MGIGNSSSSSKNDAGGGGGGGADENEKQPLPVSMANYQAIVKLIMDGSFEYLEEFLSTLDAHAIYRICSESYPHDEYKRSILHHCAWTADDRALKLFFSFCEETVPFLESVDLFGMTPLAASVYRNNYAAAKFLLTKGASVDFDKKQTQGYQLMRAAVFNRSLEMTELLVKYNCATQLAEFDVENGSLLHMACELGDLELVKCLLELTKMPVDLRDSNGIQAVHIAACRNDLELLRYLAEEKSADLNAEDAHGNVPTGWAHACQATECHDYLLEKKALIKEFNEKVEQVEQQNQKIEPEKQEEPGQEEMMREDEKVELAEIVVVEEKETFDTIDLNDASSSTTDSGTSGHSNSAVEKISKEKEKANYIKSRILGILFSNLLSSASSSSPSSADCGGGGGSDSMTKSMMEKKLKEGGGDDDGMMKVGISNMSFQEADEIISVL